MNDVKKVKEANRDNNHPAAFQFISSVDNVRRRILSERLEDLMLTSAKQEHELECQTANDEDGGRSVDPTSTES